MNPAMWLLASAIVLLAVCLCVMVVCTYINKELDLMEEPRYRTASKAAIDRQTKQIIATANQVSSTKGKRDLSEAIWVESASQNLTKGNL